MLDSRKRENLQGPHTGQLVKKAPPREEAAVSLALSILPHHGSCGCGVVKDLSEVQSLPVQGTYR